ARVGRTTVEPCVKFVGNVPHAEMAGYYSAADVLVLASSREGWANVLLEALACGTPGVATAVFGTPEVITSRELGALVTERTAPAIAAALSLTLQRPFDRGRLRRHAEEHSWEGTAQGVFAVLEGVVERAQQVARGACGSSPRNSRWHCAPFSSGIAIASASGHTRADSIG